MKSYPTKFALEVLRSFSDATTQLKDQGLWTPALTLEQLDSALSPQQKQIVAQILKLNPADYGVTTHYIGMEPVPSDLAIVSGQQYMEDWDTQALADKYVPRPIYDAFVRMDQAFQADHPNRRLLIESGYRSPAWQIITFVNWCANAYEGDIATTIRHASPPAYSQHTIASKTALDIKNIDGSPDNEHPENFKDTVEYRWLREHANEFGFYESWPEGNTFGMRAEPWHWQYLGSK